MAKFLAYFIPMALLMGGVVRVADQSAQALRAQSAEISTQLELIK